MKEQSKHVPSMDYAKNIYKVASKLKDFTALEVGAAWGFSTLAILEAGAKSLISVDNNVMIEAPNEAKANGYDNYSWSCVRSSVFWEENSVSFDLVYIDGSHLYRDVVNDLYEGWKCVNPGGYLMLDDWDHKKNIQAEDDTTEYGVSLAAFEFWRDHVNEILEVNIEGRILWFKK